MVSLQQLVTHSCRTQTSWWSERDGFEPPVGLPLLRFSRPPLSTTQPTLRSPHARRPSGQRQGVYPFGSGHVNATRDLREPAREAARRPSAFAPTAPGAPPPHGR